MRYLLLFFIFFFIASASFNSQSNLDSLWNVWEDEKEEDTVRQKALISYNKSFIYTNPDSALTLAIIGEQYADKVNNLKYKSKYLNQQGLSFAVKSDFTKALLLYDKSLSICQQNKDEMSEAKTLMLMGNIYVYKGDLEKSLMYYTKCLRLFEKEKFKKGIAAVYNNMALISSDQGNQFKAKEYHNKSLLMSKELHDESGISRSYMNLAIIYKEEGKLEKALSYFYESLLVKEKLKDYKGLGLTYNNLGTVYMLQGRYSKALEFFDKGLNNFKRIKNKKGIAGTYSNIGAVYEAMEEYEKAMEFFEKSIAIRIEIDVKKDIGESYTNIGSMYEKQKKYFQSIEFFNKSLELYTAAGFKAGVANQYYNLGKVYLALEDKEAYDEAFSKIENINEFDFTKFNDHNFAEEAEELLNKSLKINKDIKSKEGIATSYLGLKEIYKRKGEMKKARDYAEKAYSMAKEIGSAVLLKDASKSLFNLYKLNKEYDKSLTMYEEYILYRDSLQNKENQKALIQHEYRSQYEKQAATDSIEHLKAQKIKEVQISKQEAELKSKRIQQYALFGGLGLVVLFALFMLKKNKQIQQQKKEIEIQKNFAEEQQHFAENQKEELAHQHNQIRDSIDYAQTLQKAVLPSFEDVTNNFTNNFVYFQPKDVVSGDFFWTFAKKEIKYLAVVDCTGHGVPGAFMTIVANNLLNEIVLENYSTPKEIIEELHKRIKVRIGGHKDAKVRDSMDLGLLSYDAKAKKVNFVGTHTSLYLVRNNKLQKIKGSKADIGYSDEIKVEEHVVEVQENDMLYFHSDGFPDQKGGPKGKKFYYQPIRNKFEEICLLNLEEQKSIMKKTFNDWKGDNEQLDDVCMIGIRI